MDKSADNFINLIRDLIRDELRSLDDTSPCEIQSINADGSLNIFLLPDRSTLITGIINASKYEFNSGDIGVLYKIKNKINNSFVIAKYNP